MLKRKTEILIFVIVYLILTIPFIAISNNIKATVLPVNVGDTTEQIIESEFGEHLVKDVDYKYRIVDDYLFVYLREGIQYMATAFRNPNSGFMFSTPGLFHSKARDIAVKTVVLKNDKIIIVTITKYFSDYLIDIYDAYNTGIVFFDNLGNELESMSIEDSNKVWIYVIRDTDNSQDIGIYGQLDGEIIYIIGTDEL